MIRNNTTGYKIGSNQLKLPSKKFEKENELSSGGPTHNSGVVLLFERRPGWKPE